uniref:Uncharacterized protein n=1 Tax=Terrapene triunguis TaxID=2587831 RepID=A0A674J119_9SAUR
SQFSKVSFIVGGALNLQGSQAKRPQPEILPRPSISLSPTGVTAPGANVTIRCQGQRQDVRFFLHKAGDLNPPRHMDPAGDGAEFHIPTVGRQHGGNYNCSYRPQSEPFVSSYPSSYVELVVAGEGPGSTSPLPALPGGRYSCSYHSRSEPFAVLYPSDPMELVVGGKGPGSASPFPAPDPARPSRGLGGNGTLRARLWPCCASPGPWELTEENDYVCASVSRYVEWEADSLLVCGSGPVVLGSAGHQRPARESLCARGAGCSEWGRGHTWAFEDPKK